jgi:hypothetical protein
MLRGVKDPQHSQNLIAVEPPVNHTHPYFRYANPQVLLKPFSYDSPVCSPETFDFIYSSMWHGKEE